MNDAVCVLSPKGDQGDRGVRGLPGSLGPAGLPGAKVNIELFFVIISKFPC